jgi:hypothetical protein
MQKCILVFLGPERKNTMAYCVFPNGDPGEPGFGFCGKPALPRQPYCARHYHIAYIGHHERKRRLSEIETEVAIALWCIAATPELTAEQLAGAD